MANCSQRIILVHPLIGSRDLKASPKATAVELNECLLNTDIEMN